MPTLYARLLRHFRPQQFDASRRAALKATAAASAGLLLSNCTLSPSSANRRAQKQILIIGAGFAGLACAHELHAAGFDVTLLEARNRLGGRVLSFDDMVPGKIVEGGGELIGDNHLTWHAYAQKFKLSFRQIPEDDSLAQPVLLDGRKLDNAAAKKLLDDLSAALNTLNAAAKAVNPERPWDTPNAAALDARTMADWLNELSAERDTKRLLRAEWEANNGVPFEKQSYLAFLAMVAGGGYEKFWTDSETCRCAQGNQTLAKKFAAALGNRIRLGEPVASVIGSTGRMIVFGASNTQYQADLVVLAAPPSTWDRIRFVPGLPPELRPQMGPDIKYLAQVKRPYWLDARLSADSLTDSDLSMTWNATEGQEKPNPGAVLTSFSGGPAAQHLRAMQPLDRDAFYHAQLEKLYPGFAQNFLSSRFMDWPSDMWTNAGYSFPAPRQITAIGQKLYTGLPGIQFCGEHTSYAFPGYMEGALSSGAQLAKRITQKFTTTP
ncbi:MAG TPA: FAD-dependent oxidoreductase [Phycisphaerae bacterium]|nr:FAD-dependent oxidoreductase [Phycisphaerae bacterium]